eukprot:12522047-Alexandrium_andersonii.AAC.1
MAELEVRLQRLGAPRPPNLEGIAELTAHVEALEQAYEARLGTARPPSFSTLPAVRSARNSCRAFLLTSLP